MELKNIYFGSIDGKNEAKDERLLETYFDYNNSFSKLENGRFLILGNKGTGKTTLLQYYRLRQQKKGDIFIEINLNDFLKKKKLIEKQNDFFECSDLMEWIIYIELSKFILKNKSINKRNKKVKLLKEFMKKNKFDLSLDTDKIVEYSLEEGINGSLKNKWFSISNLKNIFSKNKIGNYYEYIRDLKNTVSEILKENWSKKTNIYIVFDELDNINILNKKNEEILLTLIRVANSINLKNEVIRILIGLRLDIYDRLSSTNTSKIKGDSSIILDWGKDESIDSPLLKMILHKFKISNTSIKTNSNQVFIKHLFGTKTIQLYGNKLPINKYILGKTFLKPRDIIAFFNKATELFGDCDKLSLANLQTIAADFSKNYLYTEVRNQAYSLIDLDNFDDFITILKSQRKTIFTYQDILNFINEYPPQSVTQENLKDILKSFYNFGILGNRKSLNNNPKKRDYFKYRDDYEINYDDEFTVHFGMRDYLCLNLESKYI